MDIETLTEEQAYDLFIKMKVQFDWQGVVFTKEDIAEAVREWNKDPDNGITLDIQDVADTFYWNRVFSDALNNEGFNCLNEALWEAKLDKEKNQ